VCIAGTAGLIWAASASKFNEIQFQILDRISVKCVEHEKTPPPVDR